MMENSPNDNNKQTVVIVNKVSGSGVGICALIFAIVGLFFLSLLFVPLSLIFSIIAIIKKQIVWGISAIIVSIIALWTSPTFWIVLAGFGLAAGR